MVLMSVSWKMWNATVLERLFDMKVNQALAILQTIPSNLPVFLKVEDSYGGGGDTHNGFYTTYDNEKIRGLDEQHGKFFPVTYPDDVFVSMPESTVADLIAALNLIPVDSMLSIEGIYCLDTRVELVPD